jgi:hypothetical protein
VAAHVWATWHQTIGHDNATCLSSHSLQTSHVICQLSTRFPAMCRMTLPRVVRSATSASCTDCTVNTFFLPVGRFEQNAISLSSDVRLNPNELRWVRDDEAYAPVRFEVIPSTLNFEQNLIPWITPPHWKAFGPPKDYFQSI